MEEPSDPKRAPYEINRTENPRTNSAEPIAVRPLLRTSVIPAAYPRYPGTSGSTQGEKKEMRPAMSATNMASNKLPSKT